MDYTTRYTSKMLEGYRFARKCHEGQTRADGSPYVVHCVGVMAYYMQIPVWSEDGAISCLLHDTMEDCGVTWGMVNDKFGTLVADTVQGLTNVFTTEAYPDLPRSLRKQREHHRLAQTPELVQTIKCLDRASNLITIHQKGIDFAAVYFDESVDLLAHLQQATFTARKILEQNIRLLRCRLSLCKMR